MNTIIRRILYWWMFRAPLWTYHITPQWMYRKMHTQYVMLLRLHLLERHR